MQILIFSLNHIQFGMPVKSIKFIEGRIENVMEMPAAPQHIRGMVTMRDMAIPVYSLSSRFGFEEQPVQYLIVIDVDGLSLGLEAAQVHGIREIRKNELLSRPLFMNDTQGYIKNVASYQQKHLVVLIDGASLLQEREKSVIQKLAASDKKQF